MGVLQAVQVKQCTCQVIFRACMISWEEMTVNWQLSPLLPTVNVTSPSHSLSPTLRSPGDVHYASDLTCPTPSLRTPNLLLPQLSSSPFLATSSFHLHRPNYPLTPSVRSTRESCWAHLHHCIQILTTAHSLPPAGCEPWTSLAR